MKNKILITTTLAMTRFLFSWAEEPILLKFSELESSCYAAHKYVEIRGFLYEGEMGTKILSAEPNLQTCCVGAKNQRKKQILINGDVGQAKPQLPVTIRGTFFISTTTNSENRPLYQIDHAVLGEPKSLLTKDSIALLALVLVICGLAYTQVTSKFGILALRKPRD
jgi:hypothetical protein